MNIRARLLLLILFATLIPALVVGLIFLEHREAEIVGARENLAASTRQIAQDLANTVLSTGQLHYGLSRARDIDTPDPAACSLFLSDVLKAHPQYTGILTIRPDGNLFCDSLRTGRKLVLTDRKYFNDALGPSGPLAVEPAFGRLTGIAVLQIAYAARDDAGKPRFVLLASFNLEQFMQSRARTLPRDSAIVALMDSGGTVLTWHPGGDKLRGTSMAGSALHRFAFERPDENLRDDLVVGGVSRIWAASALPGFPDTGLRVLVGTSKMDLLSSVNERSREVFGTLAIVWLLVLAGAWALAELGIRRQVARIGTAVTAFSGGDFSARIGQPYPRGEIGDLMVKLDHAFGVMQAQRDEIRQLNAGLERRVEERTAQLEASMRELEGFTYTVSHDLRAPLRAVDGFARIVIEDHGDQLNDEGRRLLEVVRENGRKMGNLIDDLLEFSRIGRNPLTLGPVEMRHLVEQVIYEMKANGQSLPDITLGEIPPVHGDAMLLKQVWVNLIGNAVKFSSQRERPLIEVRGEVGNGECIYSVRDNGAGFDMRFYSQLFGVFRRLHGAHEFPGTGVGLAIVQRIVARHGGRVWGEGAVGAGATFYFSLPREGPGKAA